ncbi:aminoglycoside phosphotransferase [Natronobacterium gregoryi SP2]|uniref:Aminoglycoside phosphotransferase n=1 Tax=Natronobacterium gregoryi (strain ATCC 43098 / DSM 3393 / CCM 3738 / CIP 104747 / IAM 13177 / JCM 8860 / NBRC 102187 / NCIMB 2189 / SP2) TaxID=797304 RepID=L9XQ45_NATGS|nr:aminoglycoside phosphotransferase [Natronobacterium gregoryi SP2]
MTDRIENALAQYSTESTVVRELHDVPPYRVYEIRFGGRPAVVKVDAHPRGHAADEGRVHEYVATNTSATVPEVLAVGTDHYVTAWRRELADAAEAVEPGWAYAAGEWLGTLHADTVGEFDGFGRPRNDAGSLGVTLHETWIDAVTARIEHHRRYLAPSTATWPTPSASSSESIQRSSRAPAPPSCVTGTSTPNTTFGRGTRRSSVSTSNTHSSLPPNTTTGGR